MGKLYKCPFCEKKYVNKDAVIDHIDKLHHDECQGLTPKQIYFNFTNKYALTKGYGRSVISGKPTAWNEVSGRYERFLPEERQKYREYFLANMRRAGKENIMKDMEHQKQMLAARHISGLYEWSDGSKTLYTGSYEKRFLEYLDKFLQWPSTDIMAPAPQLFPYKDEEGVEHVHIPDFYISSLNLIVNIKSAENQHYRLRDIEIEHREDAAIKASSYSYIKIYDNQFSKFFKGVEEIKKNLDDETGKKIVLESLENIGSEDDILLENFIES